MKKKETVCATLFGVDAVLLLLMWSLHGANWPPTFGRAEITTRVPVRFLNSLYRDDDVMWCASSAATLQKKLSVSAYQIPFECSSIIYRTSSGDCDITVLGILVVARRVTSGNITA